MNSEKAKEADGGNRTHRARIVFMATWPTPVTVCSFSLHRSLSHRHKEDPSGVNVIIGSSSISNNTVFISKFFAMLKFLKNIIFTLDDVFFKMYNFLSF